MRSSLGAASRFSHALLEDGNSQLRPQPETVLSLVPYRLSRRRRKRKRLLSNERAACFPANKRRFDETNPYCIVALSKVRFLLICKLKTNFSAKSPELCMWCPLTREHKQKKIQFSPLKLSGTVESVCLRKCVNTKLYLEKRSGIEKSIGR